LTIEARPLSLCTRDVSVALDARHGTPPYTFEIEGDDAGLVLVTEGASTTLQATPAHAKDYAVTVRVTDADDVTTERDLRFHASETPAIRPAELPSVCPDEMYDVELAADGGDSDDYVFTAELDAATGLSVDAGHLSGHFKNASGKRETLSVILRVESNGCVSEPVVLELTQENANADVCPHIRIVSEAPSLPPPCAGSPYLRSFDAWGGEQGYSWADVSVPRGLSFDASSRELSGIPEEAGTVTLAVTDANHRTIQSDFELPAARGSCWFAYLAPSDGTPRLNLFDALVGNRKSFPTGAGAAPVLDFKFSPDGRFIAYRTGADPNAAALRLLEVHGFRQQQLDLEGVGHYAWSDDGLTLAVGFAGGAGAFLTGVDVSGDGGSDATNADYPTFTPVAVPAPLLADPVWVAGSKLGLLVDPYGGYIEPLLTAREASSFTAPDDSNAVYFSDGVYLRAAPEGVFVVPPESAAIAYFGADGAPAVLHEEVLVAPNGRFAARAEQPSASAPGTLSIFKPTSASFSTQNDVVPEDTEEGCDAVLGWSVDGTRLVCASQAESPATGAVLAVFDVDADTGTVAPPNPVRGTYAFPSPSQGQTGLARLFSPRGGRFAFATSARTYVTPTAAGAATVDVIGPDGTAPSAVALAFSPDERFLAEQRDSKLRVFDFQGASANWLDVVPPAGEPAAALPCSEDLRAPATPLGPGTPYCGAFNEHLTIAWSPDSRLLAFATSAGAIYVEDFRLSTLPTELATTECGSACVAGENFAFQP